jgi:hypothetical protein
VRVAKEAIERGGMKAMVALSIAGQTETTSEHGNAQPYGGAAIAGQGGGSHVDVFLQWPACAARPPHILVRQHPSPLAHSASAAHV